MCKRGSPAKFGIEYEPIGPVHTQAGDQARDSWQAVVYEFADGKKSAVYAVPLGRRLSAAARGDF